MEVTSKRPFFSICIPCFNHGKYVGKTIQSVLKQDFENFEIIVADNASTDNSREIVRSFDDQRIRLIENRYNIGFTPNLQQVTRHARGHFINLLSSDDIMNTGALRTYAELILRQRESDRHHLVLMSQAWDIDGNDEVIGYRTKDKDRLIPLRVRMPREAEILEQELQELHRGFEVFRDCMKLFNTPGVFCSMAYSRELWEAVEGYNSTQVMNPDKHFILKVLRRDPLVIFVNRPLYSYRSHEMGQAMQQSREKTLHFQIDQYNYLTQYDEHWLKDTGVTRNHQRVLFIERDCLTHALFALTEGRWVHATRLLAFAWSTYPNIVIKQSKAWLVAALIIIGPIGILLAKVLYFARKRYGKNLPSLAEMSVESCSSRLSITE